MDPELFRKKLEEFAELKQVKTPKTAAIRESDGPETVFRGGAEFSVEADNNPTLNWEIKKLKPHIAVCEDCHDVTTDRRIEHKLNDTPYKHWRSRCTACEMYKDPATGKFCMTGHEFRAYLCTAEASKSHLRPVYKKPTK